MSGMLFSRFQNIPIPALLGLLVFFFFGAVAEEQHFPSPLLIHRIAE